MRALTDNEKRFCEALLENEERFLGQKPLGDVILTFLGIEYFEKDKSLGQIENSPFTVRMGIKTSNKDEVMQGINEAIALVLLLEKEGMIFYTPIERDRIIGEKSLLMDCTSTPIKINCGFLNTFGVNTWSLLNSFYYLTNSFKAFVHHGFRTIENQRHRQTMIVSWTAVIVALITSIASIFFSTYSRRVEIIDTQFDTKKELINKLIYQNDSIIQLMKSHDEDTVKINQFKNKQ